MRNRFVDELDRLAETDPNIFLVVGDLGHGVVDGFAEHHPERFINAGISEQNMTSVAAGLALEGYTVYTYSIGNFPTLRCLEQIRNDICYHGANVKIIAVGGGLAYGQLGMSHHATEDLAIMRALPGMRVFSPADPQEALAVLQEVNRSKGPCYIRLGKGREENVDMQTREIDVYRPVQVKQGDRVHIYATGPILREAVHAADILESRGISTGVFSVISLKPLNAEPIISSALSCDLIVTLEEHNKIGGLGGAVAEIVSGQPGVRAPLMRIGLRDQYAEVVGSQAFLRRQYGLDGESVALKVEEILKRTNGIAADGIHKVGGYLCQISFGRRRRPHTLRSSLSGVSTDRPCAAQKERGGVW